MGIFDKFGITERGKLIKMLAVYDCKIEEIVSLVQKDMKKVDIIIDLANARYDYDDYRAKNVVYNAGISLITIAKKYPDVLISRKTDIAKLAMYRLLRGLWTWQDQDREDDVISALQAIADKDPQLFESTIFETMKYTHEDYLDHNEWHVIFLTLISESPDILKPLIPKLIEHISHPDEKIHSGAKYILNELVDYGELEKSEIDKLRKYLEEEEDED